MNTHIQSLAETCTTMAEIQHFFSIGDCVFFYWRTLYIGKIQVSPSSVIFTVGGEKSVIIMAVAQAVECRANANAARIYDTLLATQCSSCTLFLTSRHKVVALPMPC